MIPETAISQTDRSEAVRDAAREIARAFAREECEVCRTGRWEGAGGGCPDPYIGLAEAVSLIDRTRESLPETGWLTVRSYYTARGILQERHCGRGRPLSPRECQLVELKILCIQRLTPMITGELDWPGVGRDLVEELIREWAGVYCGNITGDLIRDYGLAQNTLWHIRNGRRGRGRRPGVHVLLDGHRDEALVRGAGLHADVGG